MGNMLMNPQTTTEIKVLADLLGKELDVAMKIGEIKQAPKKVEVDLAGTVAGLPTTPEMAMRVVTTDVPGHEDGDGRGPRRPPSNGDPGGGAPG